MSNIVLVGVGGFFTRSGLYVGVMNQNNTFWGTTQVNDTNDIRAQFNSTDQFVVDQLYTNLFANQGSSGSWIQYLQNLLNNTILQMATDSQPPYTISVTAALQLLIAQMINVPGGGTLAAPVNSIKPNTVSVAVTNYTSPSNNGDGVFCASAVAADGGTLQDVFAETMTATVTADSVSGGATAGSETVTVAGVVGPTTTTNFYYATVGYGSNANLSFTAIDPTVSSGGAGSNLLAFSDFQTFGGSPATNADVPTGWTVPGSSGVAGTDIKKNASAPLYGSTVANLKFIGDGSTLSGVQQQLNSATGASAYVPQPRDVVCGTIRLYSTTPPAAGALKVGLYNSSGSLLTNDWGTQQLSPTMSISGLVAATWTAFTFYFQLPSVLPADGIIYYRVRLSTAITAAGVCYLSYGALAYGNQAYNAAGGVAPAGKNIAGGPYVNAFSGQTDFLVGDGANVAVANDYASNFAMGNWRLFNLPSLGLRIPYATNNTINDGLVTT